MQIKPRVPRTFPPRSAYLNVTCWVFILIIIVFHYRRADFSSQLKSKIGNILAKVEALRINLNIDGAPIASRSHTHPSHSQTSRLLTSSLSLGVPDTSPPSNPVYTRRVDPSALAFSLSSHRHSYISLLCRSRFIT